MENTLVLKRALDAARHLSDPTPPWCDFIRSSAELMRGYGGGFLSLETGKPVELQEFGVDSSAVTEYISHFHRHDILVTEGGAFRAPGTWLDTQKALQRVGERNSAYYHDFMRKHRMNQMVVLVLEENERYATTINFQRDHVEDTDQFLASEPIVTFKKAIQEALAKRRERASQWIVSAEAVLRGFGEAMCLVDSGGVVLHASPSAGSLLEGNCSLRIRNGRFWHPSERVRDLISSSFAKVAPGKSCKMLFPGERGRTCLFETSIAEQPYRLDSRSLFVVRLRPGRAKGDLCLDALCTSIGLTEAEAAVLHALVSGEKAADIAAAHGVTINTVRKQIATVMEKAGCTRQVDLVRTALAAT
ncbi:LuxR C-terminal-related transcriptional regulator [Variovorax sp. YR216]|uniref:helix-turn-helix transcriptional regulator n=1 Tax=Variovorax sp. YR216 TaxID=1882828 RepID=UPI000896B25E|nr:LuxR C-terminal-related transcriptional regulator [Variovorax sp. YR216]SEB06683.1 DNA-binding transcriptional regulator, CsgD family [Variovorax sp. YR216]